MNEKSQIERLQAINDVTLAVSRLDLVGVLETVHREVGKLMDTSFFYVGLYDSTTGHISLKHIYDDNRRVPDYTALIDTHTGISGWVIHNRQSLLIDDVEHDPLPSSIIYYGVPVRSLISVPLIAQDEVVGVISVQSRTPDTFNHADMVLLEAIASPTAIAIRNAQLFDSVQRRLHETRALHELAQIITGTQDIDVIIQTVTDDLCAIFQGSVCTIALCKNDQLVIHTSIGEYSLPSGHWEVGEEILRRMQNMSLYIADTHTSDLLGLSADIRSLLAVPLIVGERTLGILAIGSVGLDAFTIEHERVLGIAAAQVAAAIENARLLQETRAHAIELKTAYAELQELDALRQEVVENISHELRSPLTYTRGYVGLMGAEELGPITDDQAHALSIIDRKTDMMLRLISDILEPEKISRTTLQYQQENLVSLVTQAVQGAKLAYADSGINFEMNLPDIPVSVWIDPIRIDQALGNLISNAVKFSDSGSTVQVCCKNYSQSVRVTVLDEGIGIPSDKVKRIFERFYRVPGSKREGIGIGLAIVRQIIDAHGGTVHVESEVGQGSAFSFDLPLTREAAASGF